MKIKGYKKVRDTILEYAYENINENQSIKDQFLDKYTLQEEIEYSMKISFLTAYEL